MEETQKITLTKGELKEIVSESVYETFTLLGLDHENPLEMQRDFQYLREWRTASEKIKTQGLTVIIGIIITGLCAALWLGLKQIF
jgi:hypothetical protein